MKLISFVTYLLIYSMIYIRKYNKRKEVKV